MKTDSHISLGSSSMFVSFENCSYFVNLKFVNLLTHLANHFEDTQQCLFSFYFNLMNIILLPNDMAQSGEERVG